MRVAITRAMPEAEATAARLKAHGAAPVIAPLLRIEARAFDADVGHAQALLFTSLNGVRAFAAANPARDARVLTVGDVTARAARAAGFADVRSADGDVAALATLARGTLDPAGGTLVHVGGADLAGDLAGELSAAGFKVERRIAYAAAPVGALPDAFSTSLDAVLFYSARAADVFLQFGAPGAARLTAACMSPGVAEKASQTRWKTIIVAPAPREDALLAALLQG